MATILLLSVTSDRVLSLWDTEGARARGMPRGEIPFNISLSPFGEALVDTASRAATAARQPAVPVDKE